MPTECNPDQFVLLNVEAGATTALLTRLAALVRSDARFTTTLASRVWALPATRQ
jgi:hypothetical protein